MTYLIRVQPRATNKFREQVPGEFLHHGQELVYQGTEPDLVHQYAVLDHGVHLGGRHPARLELI